MKIELHIPVEQYGFVSVETDSMEEDVGTFSRRLYDTVKDAFSETPQNALPDKDMTDFIYNYLHGKGNSPETFESLSHVQRIFMKSLHNARQRK